MSSAGQLLGSYKLLERLGAGGMGEVWRAEDTKLLREVAIKILPAQLASDPEWKSRFLREARTIAQLNHPNIATIYGIEETRDHTLFIAMELVRGDSVAALVSRGPMVPADAVRVAVHVADGLSEAHAQGIIHRDIKPDNILVSPRFVKVLDFGIAKKIGGTADPSLTQGGMVMGTPHYMSPEQALGRSVDARTDIFSLGVVLYEMLSGTKPFTGEAITEVMLKIVMSEAPDISILATGITPKLADVVRRCMAKEPDKRFPNCDELRDQLAASLRASNDRLRQSSVPTISMRKTPKPSEAPRVVPPPPAPVAPPTPAPTPVAIPRVPGEKRALVADDDPATRYLLGSILSRYRIAFDEAANGADAVKCLKQSSYTMVFIDLLMPRVDGWGVLDYIRNHRGPAPPQIYIVTGVQNQKLSAADQDLVTGVVYKPIDIGQVEKLVEKG